MLALHEPIKQAEAHIDKEPVFTNEFGYFTFYDSIAQSYSSNPFTYFFNEIPAYFYPKPAVEKREHINDGDRTQAKCR